MSLVGVSVHDFLKYFRHVFVGVPPPVFTLLSSTILQVCSFPPQLEASLLFCFFFVGQLHMCFFSLIFIRWKRTSGGVLLDGGKKVLEFVAIQRKDNSQWAIPGVSSGLFFSSSFKKLLLLYGF